MPMGKERYGTKHCVDCGAEFAKSATDYTVRCPSCRKGGRPKTTGARVYSPMACTMCGHVHTTLKCDWCGF